jgi:hypothetical protein
VSNPKNKQCILWMRELARVLVQKKSGDISEFDNVPAFVEVAGFEPWQLRGLYLFG